MKGIKVKRQPVPQYISGKPQFEKNPKEVLSGMVQGKKASAPEERTARALQKAGLAFAFAVPLGAPQNTPGWKQADFVIDAGGMIKTMEVDTLFTHREKLIKDKLHDAIVLDELGKVYGDAVWPKVYRAMGETDLADQKSADRWVVQNIARSA